MPRTPAGQQLLREFNVDTSRLPAAIRHDGTVQDPIFTDRTFHDGRGIPPGRRCRSRRVCRESSAAGDVRYGSVKKVAGAVGEGSVAVGSVHRYLAEMVVARSK